MTDTVDCVDAKTASGHKWRLIVRGTLLPAHSGRTYQDFSPVTESDLCAVPDGDADDVDAAVEAGEHTVKENDASTHFTGIPFGGCKGSGIGKE